MGGIITNVDMRHQQFLKDEQRIRRVINEHPEFRMLNIYESSIGFGYLGGELPSEGARQELRRMLIRQGGEEWADRCLSIAISVAVPPEKSIRGDGRDE